MFTVNINKHGLLTGRLIPSAYLHSGIIIPPDVRFFSHVALFIAEVIMHTALRESQATQRKRVVTSLL